MVSLTIEIEGMEGFAELPGLTQRIVSRAVKLAATDVWGNVAREAPVDHGRLAGSFELDRSSDLYWNITTRVNYAAFVHEGTGLYGPMHRRITPSQASVLAFVSGGKQVFAKSVSGQRPNPYADRAVKRTDSRAQVFADIAVRELVTGP